MQRHRRSASWNANQKIMLALCGIIGCVMLAIVSLADNPIEALGGCICIGMVGLIPVVILIVSRLQTRGPKRRTDMVKGLSVLPTGHICVEITAGEPMPRICACCGEDTRRVSTFEYKANYTDSNRYDWSRVHPLLHTIARLAMLLAPVSAPQAAEAPAHGTDPGRMPAFSWDCMPLYVHIRKDTAFTDDEIKHLATFPLITFEKSTGNKDSGSTEAGTLKAARAVKAINPATKILYYRNVIVHYGGYAANASLKDIPGAFLVGPNGNGRLIRGRVEAYDLTNKALRDWWLAAAKPVASDPAIDGLFLDGVVKILEPGFLKSQIGAEKKTAELAGYVAMMEDTRKMLGPQKLMLANVLRARLPDSGLGAMKALDGSYIEGFEGAVGMLKKDYVAKGMEAIQKAARQGAIIAFTCGLGSNQQDADETPVSAAKNSEPVKRGGDAMSRFNYQMAMFLICAEKHSYFDLHDGYDAKTSKTWMTRPAEFDRPLGAPKGPAVREGHTFTREFAHASVRLDLETETGDIVWKNATTK